MSRVLLPRPSPLGVAFHPDGRFAYVANRQSFGPTAPGDVSVIDTSADSVVATVKVGNNPTSVAIGPVSLACAGDYLLADFAEHEGLFGTVSRAVASRLPRVLIRPLPLYL